MRLFVIVGLAAACSAPSEVPVREARVNLRETAQSALTQDDEAPRHHGGIPDGASPEFHAAIGDPARLVSWPARRGLRPFMPGEPTPELVHSFQGLGDDNRSVPPDTHGAVGPDHLVVTLNTQFRVQDRNGGELSTVSLDSFWRDLGADAFDPRVFYDHFEDRWITLAVGDARTESSAVLLGVTDDGDPQGDWSLRRYDADAADQTWADYPVLGFNRRWIAIQNNMFDFDGDFLRGDLWVLDKADLYAGGDGRPRVMDIGHIGTLMPAVVFDEDEDDLHCVVHWSGQMQGRGFVRLYRITGDTDDPELEDIEFASVDAPWAFGPPGQADFAPQAGSAVRLQNNDARIHSVVQREGSIWAVHTNFLPAGAPTRSAVRFWELGKDATVRQTGLIDGLGHGRMYAFPSLAVNASRDVMIGFSEFGADIFPSAGYAFRSNRDVAGEIREVLSLREGEAPYEKVRGGRNRWGDYSATAVDPNDDHTLWTLQEYAAPPADGADRFGVWWGAITPPGAPPVWAERADLAVDEGQLVDVELIATDADGDALQYFGEELPDGAAVDDDQDPPHLVWTPSFDQAGAHPVRVSVTDGGGITRLRFEVVVAHVDRPPTLADPGDLQVRALQRLTLMLDGRDPDGDPLEYSGGFLPAGASLDEASGRFSWLPSVQDEGDHALTFTVSAAGRSAQRSITVTVAGINRPPVLTPPQDATFDEGGSLSVTIEADDPDGDPVTLLFDPMPVGGRFDGAAGFHWSADFEQEGVHEIGITATDGTLSDVHIWRIEVRPVNRPPEFVPVGPQQLAEGEQMLFFAEAVDPDGGEVELSAESLPGVAQFNPDTGACMWNAGFGASGEWMVVLAASDGQAQVVLRVPVSIEDVNRPPVLARPVVPAASEGQELALSVVADDPDGDAVVLELRDAPVGMVFDAGSGALTWTPGFDQAGTHLLTVVASDGDLSDESLVVIEVADTNRPPLIDGPVDVDVNEGDNLRVALSASDPDGDLVRLNVDDLPVGAVLSVDGVLTWTPSHDDAGDHVAVVVASDGDLESRAPLTIRVADVDRPPSLAPIPDVRAAEGEELTIEVQAADHDGDLLRLSVDGAQGLSLDGRTIRWTPSFEQAGVHAVVVAVEAGEVRVEQGFSVTVSNTDRPPTLEITGDPAAGTEGEPVALTLVGLDPDGDEVTFAAATLPEGATVNAGAGVLAWTPSFEQAGTHPAVLLALAGGAVTRLAIEFVVANVDRPPSISITGPSSGREGEPVELRLVADDPDGAQLTVTAPTLPRGAELDGWVIRWTPDFDQAGDHRIEALASDGTLEARAEVVMSVAGANRAPELVAPAPAKIDEDKALRVVFEASDPDGDELTYTASGLPPTATLHRSLGALTWTPSFADAGDYAVELTVSDGVLSAQALFELTVRNVNRPPEVTVAAVHHVKAGGTLVFTATGSDPDGDELTFTAAPLPSGALMSATTGQFRWTPAASDAGQPKLTVTANDGALTANAQITIFVSAPDEGGCAVGVPAATSCTPAILRGGLRR